MKLKQSWQAHRKWWIIGGVSTLLLIAIGGFVAWSSISWQAYEKNYNAWRTDLQAASDKAFGLQAGDAAAKDKKMAAFRDVQTIFERGRAQCGEYSVLHWQQFIASVRGLLERCQQQVQKSQAFSRDLQAVVSYLQSEQNIAKTFELGKVEKLDETGWKQQPQTWTEIKNALAKQRGDGSFKETQLKAIEKADQLQQAWGALVAAHEAKDRAKYEEAQGKLAGHYDSLSEIAAVSEKYFQPLVTALIGSYTKAFK